MSRSVWIISIKLNRIFRNTHSVSNFYSHHHDIEWSPETWLVSVSKILDWFFYWHDNFLSTRQFFNWHDAFSIDNVMSIWHDTFSIVTTLFLMPRHFFYLHGTFLLTRHFFYWPDNFSIDTTLFLLTWHFFYWHESFFYWHDNSLLARHSVDRKFKYNSRNLPVHAGEFPDYKWLTFLKPRHFSYWNCW